MKISLLIIDPQNDFCSASGSLHVPNAENDCATLSSFIKSNYSKIDQIHVTLDSHQNYHIAHPVFWLTKNGEHPAPFTSITYESFSNGEYTPVLSEMYQKAEDYLLALENRGRYTLTIWPPHCLIGTTGACVYPDVYDSILFWELSHNGINTDYIVKSPNPMTEHYSAINAEVPDPADSSTRTNFQLIDKLKASDKIIIAGEALSHCVANTVRDLSIYINPHKLTLLTDCCSNVAGFESIGNSFIEEFKQRGMDFQTTTTITL